VVRSAELVHDIFGLELSVSNQYPSVLIRAFELTGNARGRRELFTEQAHRPVKNCILEKSGFGFIGIGVVSTDGPANAVAEKRASTPVTKAALKNRMGSS
jgi:hypothetical protein